MTILPNSRFQRVSVLAALYSLGLAAIIAAAGCSYTQIKTPPPAEKTYDDTYYEDEQSLPPDGFPALDPYGRWVPVGDYGWAWQPDVYSDWRPYYYGHWNWTHWGWTWVSYEPFGWATYHYGNWVFDPYWGWVWFADYEWYPNRVNWIVYDDYICWAPMPIHGYMIGDPWMHEHEPHWNIAHLQDFQHPYVGDYHVRDFRPTVYRNDTKLIYKAPEVSYIEQHTGRTVTKITMGTKPAIGGHDGLKKLKTPADQQIRMREMQTRTHKALYGKRADGESTRTSSKTVTTQPNIITPPSDRDAGKSKGDSKPNKQEPDDKAKKEKKPDAKAREGTRPTKQKSKKDKGDDESS